MNYFLAFIIFALCFILHIRSFQISNSITLNNQHISLNDNPCNITFYKYVSAQQLSKNTYMAQAFSKLNNIYISYMGWNASDTQDYTIGQFRYLFNYHTQNQTSYINPANIVVVEGGYADFNVTFKWWKTRTIGEDDRETQKYGIGFATSKTKQISFAYSTNNNQSSPTYQIQYVTQIKFQAMNLQNQTCEYNNCTVEDQDRYIISGMLDKIPQSYKSQFQSELNRKKSDVLANELCCSQVSQTSSSWQYEWRKSPDPHSDYPQFTIYRKEANLTINRGGAFPGILHTYKDQMYLKRNNLEQACGPVPTSTPLDPKIYGGNQQFISMTFAYNLVTFAHNYSQILNTNLNESEWTTRNFKFKAANLIPILSNISQTFQGYQSVYGNCTVDNSTIKLSKETISTLNFFASTLCQLNINKKKIIEFKFNFSLQIEAYISSNSIDFWIRSFKTPVITYNDTFGFKMIDKTLADSTIVNSMDILYEKKVFGSGWPIWTQREKTYFMVTDDAIVLIGKNPINLQNADNKRNINNK